MKKGFYYGKFVVMGIAAMILFTFAVMWLWNWLMPELFNGPVLGYWQTLGLLVLSKILFSGIGKSGSSHSSRHSRHGKCDEDYHSKYKSNWRKKYEEKMNGKVEGENQEGDVIVTD